MKKLFTFLTLFLVSLPLLAENTATLPAGRFRARVKPIYAFGFSTQFGNDGIEKSLVSHYAKTIDFATAQKLDASGQLADLMTAAGLKSSTLGSFAPSLEVSTLVMGSALEYGLTPNLTLGVIVPVVSARTNFELAFNKSAQVLGHPSPTVRNLDMVKAAQDSAAKAGYAPLENWNALGLGDIELGLKYRFWNSQNWSLATKSGVRLPTGRVDDPNVLTDIGFGDGQTDLGSTLLVDYIGIPHTLLNTWVKYTVQLPDRQLLRVPNTGELFTTKSENIRRNLGDRVDAAVTAEYSFLTAFNINATYAFFSKQKDRFQSDLGFNAPGLEANTAQQKHSADVGIGFSTLPWFRQGSFKLPMDAGLNLEVPLAGKNVAKATAVNLEYKLYF
ncbi:MAG: transporter [Deltaproteobacteria bacterium]|nr:transporter [Deltaproteobacteria bacterium]